MTTPVPGALSIAETTVGEIGGVSIGVGNVYADDDGVLRASLSFWMDASPEATHRMAQGATIQYGAKNFQVLGIKAPEGQLGTVIVQSLP